MNRYDYEECETEAANKMMAHLQNLLADDAKAIVGKSYSSESKSYVIKKADNFSYVDPIDQSVAKNQVRRFKNWIRIRKLFNILF